MKATSASSPHHSRQIMQLHTDRKLATACASLAVDGLNNTKTRGGSLLLLRSFAEAFRGLDAVARDASVRPVTLRRALSRSGNPRIRVIEAIVEAMGLRLSVVPKPKKARKRPAKRPTKTARVRARAA